MGFRRTTGVIASLIALLGAVAAPCRAGSEPEDELKAAVVLSFLRYTQFANPTRAAVPIVACVAGRPEFARTLRRTLEGKLVESHPITVAEVKSLGAHSGCQLLYVATGRRQEIREAMSAMGAARALTVGESDHFLDLGGAVNLTLVDGRVTFEADLDALERAGISISSKLLRFGQIRGRGKARM